MRRADAHTALRYTAESTAMVAHGSSHAARRVSCVGIQDVAVPVTGMEGRGGRRNKRCGTEGRDGRESENGLAEHGSILCWVSFEAIRFASVID